MNDSAYNKNDTIAYDTYYLMLQNTKVYHKMML